MRCRSLIRDHLPNLTESHRHGAANLAFGLLVHRTAATAPPSSTPSRVPSRAAFRWRLVGSFLHAGVPELHPAR
jgi:hypothetical protein